jgi:hypothetical protein
MYIDLIEYLDIVFFTQTHLDYLIPNMVLKYEITVELSTVIYWIKTNFMLD